MPTLVNRYQLEELVHEESKSEILLLTTLNTELHIVIQSGRTIIRLPFGNKFDIINGDIIIYEK